MASLLRVFGANGEYTRLSLLRNSRTIGHHVRNTRISTINPGISYLDHPRKRTRVAPPEQEMASPIKTGWQPRSQRIRKSRLRLPILWRLMKRQTINLKLHRQWRSPQFQRLDLQHRSCQLLQSLRTYLTLPLHLINPKCLAPQVLPLSTPVRDPNQLVSQLIFHQAVLHMNKSPRHLTHINPII